MVYKINSFASFDHFSHSEPKYKEQRGSFFPHKVPTFFWYDLSLCLNKCNIIFYAHKGDITDLAVSSNNALVASSSNDCTIRVVSLVYC
jgi:WD40 repeat protein